MAKMNKKFVATSLTAAMVATVVAPVAGAAFTDSIPTYAKDAVDYVADKGIMTGSGDGTFKAGADITRAEVAVLLAKALGLETEGKTADFADVPEKHWASGAIAAVVEKGIAKGKDFGFDPSGKITRQEAAVMFANAYELELNEKVEVSFADQSKIATWASEQVEILASLGVFGGKTGGVFAPTDLITRGEVAVLVHRAVVEDVRLPVEEVITEATKVASVSATNLKEIVVTFDGTVTEEDATEKANYSLKSGKAIQSAVLSEDQKTVTLTVVGTLANNKADAVSVAFLGAKNVEFTTGDNELPEVESIKSLGTKSLKVVFTEPVTDLKQSNFTLDGKAYFGKVELGANNRSVILTPYSTSALAAGDHKVTISGVKDYAGFVSLSSTHDFTVVEDKDAPTVVEATATLESVTLTFSEDVDPSTIAASKVYWKSGDSKKPASSVEQLADNKFKYTFSTTNSLPTGSVNIHVEGVKDYSGNEIVKDTMVSVTPEIDQTRPEVKKVSVINSTQIKVTFSKAILPSSAADVKNYTVLNKDGKVISVRGAALDSTDSKSVIVTLYSALSEGENTLTIKNVKDATKLQNTMLDYSEKIVKADVKAPTYYANVNTTDKRVVINFSEKMNIDTLVDYSNYLVKVNGSLRTLTADMADISVVQDGAAVVITFAETINSNDVVFTSDVTPASNEVNINELTVLGVKDLAGNLLTEFTATPPTNVISLGSDTVIQTQVFDATNYPTKVAEFVDTKTIKVRFNTAIVSSTSNAFTASLGSVNQVIESVEVDGTNYVTVKFKNALPTDPAGLTLTVDKTKLTDITGKFGTGTEIITKATNLLDSVAPVILYPASLYSAVGEVITITYSENLVVEALADIDLTDTDFEIVRISDNKKLNPLVDYDVTIGSALNTLEITLTDTATRTVGTSYTVTVKDATYFTDVEGNEISNSVGETESVVSGTAVTAATDAVTAAQTAKTTADAAVTAAQATAATAATDLTAAQTAKTTADAAVTAAQATAATAASDLLADSTNPALIAAKTAADAAVTAAQATAATAASDLLAAQAAKTTADAAVTAAQATAATAASDLLAAQAALAALLA